MILSLNQVPEDIRESQRLVYHDLTLTMAQVAELLCLSESAVYERAKAWGWPGRRQIGLGIRQAFREVPPPSPDAAAASSPDLVQASREAASRKGATSREPMSDRDRVALASDMERVVADRIAALKRDAASGRRRDGERTAREIAHYTRSLTTLRGYRGTLPRDDAAGAPGGDPPRDLGELRDELRRHLERIWEEERASRLRGRPDRP